MAETNQANKHIEKTRFQESVHCCLTLKIKVKNVGLVLDWLSTHTSQAISQSSVSKTFFFFNSFGALNSD